MTGPSAELLWRLVSERLVPGADRASIDQRIRDQFEETWAVVFTDLVGFSRRTEEFGIIHFLSVISEKERLLKPVVEAHAGLILKTEADSWLILFRDVGKAVQAMLASQATCTTYNAGRPEEDQVQLCVGIGYGPMLRIGDHDVWGREVNLASKLGEDTARSGEILLTEAAAQDARQRLGDLQFEPGRLNGSGLSLDYQRLRYTL